jgi:CRP/FNR family transcriptional regulator, anaerobic regulatory protein
MIESLKVIQHFNIDLLKEIKDYSVIKNIPKNTEIIRDGQYITSIPIVISGLVKVFTTYNEKEFLLYYIKPSESCVLSFIISQKQEPSTIFANTEEDSQILLMPFDKVAKWIKKYPEFSAMYFNQFNYRYYDLIETLNHVLFDRLDTRLYSYLNDKAIATNTKTIVISHKDIAFELGTSREVITRVLKKLESENKILQTSQGIKII